MIFAADQNRDAILRTVIRDSPFLLVRDREKDYSATNSRLYPEGYPVEDMNRK